MELQKIEAFVLRRIKYGDTSLIVSLFSSEIGRFSAIAKGVRSGRSRSIQPATLEPITRIEAIVYEKSTRTVQLLKSAETIEDYHLIKKDLEKFDIAMKLIMSIEELVPENEPSEKIYNILKSSLSELQKAERKAPFIELSFHAKLLSSLGYAPSISRCSVCGEKIIGKAKYSSEEGGLLCENCAETGIILDGEEVELLASLFTQEPQPNLDDISAQKTEKIRTVLELHSRYYAKSKKR